jgi:hypothetical protein
MIDTDQQSIRCRDEKWRRAVSLHVEGEVWFSETNLPSPAQLAGARRGQCNPALSGAARHTSGPSNHTVSASPPLPLLGVLTTILNVPGHSLGMSLWAERRKTQKVSERAR